MKEVIKTTLDKYNNTSYSNDELSNLIIGAIKTSKWYLDLSNMDDICSHGNNLNDNCSECDEEQARESWVCGICGKSTYEVDYDYIGTNTNHLGCELEIEMKNPKESEVFTNRKIQNNYGFKDYENPKIHIEMKSNNDIEYREKSWSEKKLQYKIFKSK